MAVNAVPHHLADEPADLLETFPAVELGHAVGELVAAAFEDEGLVHGDVGLAAGGSQVGIGREPVHQVGEVAGPEIQVAVELADEIVGVQVGQFEAGVEGLDDAGPDPPLRSRWPVQDMDPGVPSGCLIGDGAGGVAAAVVNDEPGRHPVRLGGHALHGPLQVLRLILDRRDHQDAWAGRIDGGHEPNRGIGLGESFGCHGSTNLMHRFESGSRMPGRCTIDRAERRGMGRDGKSDSSGNTVATG